jgi:Bacterial capsule synthesis protein PGA_cap
VRRRRAVALGVLALLLGGAVAFALARGGDSGSGADPSAARPAPAPARPAADGGARAAARPSARTVRFAVVGDIVMGTPDYGLPPDGGASFFSGVDGLLTCDVVLGNLEGTLATGGSSKCGAGSSNCFAFRTPPSYARWLRRAGFTVVNLANNHANDYGPEGLRETVAALERAGVRHTGGPGVVARQTVHGVRVALLGFASYPWANSLTDIPAARRLVAKATRSANLVVVMMHAGAEGSDQTHTPTGAEYFLGENRGDSRAFARAVVDAGADLVVASGPHVMRGMSFRRGRLIAYSLGNFGGYKVFGLNQTTATSGVLQVTLRADGSYVSGRLRPTMLVDSGIPARGGDGIDLVGTLSREDFGGAAARIGPRGAILPPS